MPIDIKRLFILLLVSQFYLLNMQSEEAPKHEFRAVWIATMMNIDWPSKQGLSSDVQMQEIDKILDLHKSLGMNAVILQIRPLSDAIYPSNFDPWSKYLSGTQGKAPEPFYDPLDYYINACHKRGMEFHAWFNPYRIKQNAEEVLSENHIYNRHPEWGWEYNKRTYLDPGIPAVRDFLAEVVLDVVERYDIDGVHFDDYFYPYPAKGEGLPDTATFVKYSGTYLPMEIDNWRRNNVSIFVESLGSRIKKAKPWVKFGISPFGVWRNIGDDPRGSDTQAGLTNYDHIFADVLLWQSKGWIDYVVPQIYWHRGHKTADFEVLTHWWANSSFERDVYVGHGLYRLNQENRDAAWNNPKEMPGQVRITRNLPSIKGSVWFSSNHFAKNLHGFQDTLKSDLYVHPAIVPSMPWMDANRPQPPFNLRVERIKGKGRMLLWDAVQESDQMDAPRFFVVYCCPQEEKMNTTNASHIIAIVGSKEHALRRRFFLAKKEKCTFKVSALDRLNNESELSSGIFVNQ